LTNNQQAMKALYPTSWTTFYQKSSLNHNNLHQGIILKLNRKLIVIEL
jgi:hypothetical protein